MYNCSCENLLAIVLRSQRLFFNHFISISFLFTFVLVQQLVAAGLDTGLRLVVRVRWQWAIEQHAGIA